MYKEENTQKSIDGNEFNLIMDKKLKKLVKDGYIKKYKKEKDFQNVGGYKHDRIRADHYFETTKKYKIGKEIRPLRILIDNTTSIRGDRYRGKENEAFLVKKGDIADIVIINTLDFEDFESYKNQKNEIKYITNVNNQILNKERMSYVDIVLPKTDTLKFLKEVCSKEENILIKKSIKNISKKYML